jgi:hypothetical protein
MNTIRIGESGRLSATHASQFRDANPGVGE